MKILIYGAGVMGSLYGAKLKASGQDVTILARGARFWAIKEHGLVLEEGITGRRTSTQVDVVEALGPADAYDLVVVMMSKDNLPDVLSVLSQNQHTPNVLFMLNNAAGPEEMIQALGWERVLQGFPGAGGAMDGHVVRYAIVSGRQQPTTFGELDGTVSTRLRHIASAFKNAGFPVAFSRNMDAWLKTHAAEITPLANALYMADGCAQTLAKDPKGLRLAIRAIREGYRLLRANRIPITPARHRIFALVPEGVLVKLMQHMLVSKEAALILGHANAAHHEMERLTKELANLARGVTIPTPALDQLMQFNQDMKKLSGAAFMYYFNWPGM